MERAILPGKSRLFFPLLFLVLLVLAEFFCHLNRPHATPYFQGPHYLNTDSQYYARIWEWTIAERPQLSGISELSTSRTLFAVIFGSLGGQIGIFTSFRFFNIVLLIASVFLLFGWTMRMGGSSFSAFTATFLFVTSAGTITWSDQPIPEIPALLCILSVFWFAKRTDSLGPSGSHRDAWLLGMIVGACFLVKENILLLVFPLLVMSPTWDYRRRGRIILGATVPVLGMAVLLRMSGEPYTIPSRWLGHGPAVTWFFNAWRAEGFGSALAEILRYIPLTFRGMIHAYLAIPIVFAIIGLSAEWRNKTAGRWGTVWLLLVILLAVSVREAWGRIYFMTAPIVFLYAAWGIESVSARLSGRFRRLEPEDIAILCLVICAGVNQIDPFLFGQYG